MPLRIYNNILNCHSTVDCMSNACIYVTISSKIRCPYSNYIFGLSALCMSFFLVCSDFFFSIVKRIFIFSLFFDMLFEFIFFLTHSLVRITQIQSNKSNEKKTHKYIIYIFSPCCKCNKRRAM